MRIRARIALPLLAVLVAACQGTGRRGDIAMGPPPEGGTTVAAPGAEDPALTAPFIESFDSGTLDPALWKSNVDAYAARDGELVVRDAKNHPLWLLRRLPCDVQIDFTAWSDSADGDIKLEIFGDGRSSATRGGAYTATGYVVIFGGWHNTLHTIARLDEHRARLIELSGPPVERGRRYAFSLRIRGGTIEWFLDGQPFAKVVDPQPLCGTGHDHFAFSDWAAPLQFDELRITPL
jgi:hypothetical protein